MKGRRIAQESQFACARQTRWCPANTTATVLVPAKSAGAITESGKPLAEAPGVKLVGMEGDCAVLEVEVGSYRFGATAK